MGGRLPHQLSPRLSTNICDVLIFPSVGIIQKIERRRRSSLWQGNKEKRGFHLVKQKSLIVGKPKGGLGIWNLKLQSKTQDKMVKEPQIL